ncbi:MULTISPECIES: PadR family transcriptional regulator [Aerococcus]|uniref:PadR family transcriptional regulator n=2 Tax=Aerococcus TaxID=1375 RepID=A0A5N1GHK6_9LACT|nr:MULTISPECIES: PadR family transcriptional regulator [Aerococcus]MDK6369972.1 PadR family transcriptional regulator [Aerococcus sp. UMB9870]KAA9299639.1 PadR family transcriptional regulator [Aerococcus sanguinicola]MDK6680554.1 PadR family transcriptional regulator [Aerococcus sp. UMB8608]MDK6687384.1 PadR family transcriptional regulator [Aerococcus sp. UMB8623]MDK6940495.1 PadR family transcriptional regulator [Aerococcus sp. UMB8487]
MNSQLKKGVLEMMVLHQLAQRDCYGYELVQEISKHIQMSEGTVYPLLRRLKKEGLLTTYMQASESGPARKYYELTEAGAQALQAQRLEWETFAAEVTAFLGGELR